MSVEGADWHGEWMRSEAELDAANYELANAKAEIASLRDQVASQVREIEQWKRGRDEALDELRVVRNALKILRRESDKL